MIIMATKKTGISADLIIHPGETIADVLDDRNITQVELAQLTNFSPDYVNNVVHGEKNISAEFAVALEYALGVPASFWINLQAIYDSEKLEVEKETTITEEEIQAFYQIKEVIKYLRNIGKMPLREKMKDAILSARRALQISNLCSLNTLTAVGSFRMATNVSVNYFVMGAWLRICQLRGDKENITTRFDKDKINTLIYDIKKIMRHSQDGFQHELKSLMAQYGIDFSLIKHFKGAPVQGYITKKLDGSYQMVLTLRGAFADIFWFSLFHELGHIYGGHVSTNVKFIDYSQESDMEKSANAFARNALINETDYKIFVQRGHFDLSSICTFAEEQGVVPYIVIGRLHKQKILPYNKYSKEKLRYKWIK